MKRPSWLVPAAIILLMGGVIGLNALYKPVRNDAVRVTCPDLGAGCAAIGEGRQVEIGVEGRLRLLEPFVLWARVQDADKVQASFDMEGMDMGFNLYTLRPDPSGTWRTKVTLPVCITGRNDWLLHLEVDGQRFTVPFVTELPD